MKVRLCGVDDVEDEAMIQARVAGKPPFAVYKIEGDFYVTDDTCTHGKASLADEGELDGFTITCTWHDGRFDVRTGAVLAAPCSVPIRNYPAHVEDGGIWIDLE